MRTEIGFILKPRCSKLFWDVTMINAHRVKRRSRNMASQRLQDPLEHFTSWHTRKAPLKGARKVTEEILHLPQIFRSRDPTTSKCPCSFNALCCRYSAPGETQLTVCTATHTCTGEDKTEKHVTDRLIIRRAGER